MKKTIILFSFLPVLCGNAGEISRSGSALELTLSEGRLHELMQEVKTFTGSTLILKGEANSFDLTALRNLPSNVVSLDMGELKIKGTRLLKDDWFGQQSFEEDEIPAYMLIGTEIESITLPSGLKKIGDGAFSSTPLKNIKGGAVSWMGKSIFHGCSNLESADFSESKMSVIPERTFSGCASLKDISLPANVIYIGPRAFEGTAIVSANFPKANEIGDYAFANARQLEEASFSKGCKIGEGAFYGTESLSTLSSTPGHSGILSFAGTAVGEQIEIAGESVGEGAYAGTKATDILFTGSTMTVGPRAFYSMTGLKEVNMTRCETVPVADELAFENTDVEHVVLMVRKGESGQWKEAPVWQRFIVMEDESGVEEINADAGDIEVKRNGDNILISAACVISEISIYSLDGMLLDHVNPAQEIFEIKFPTEFEIVIVRVIAGNTEKISKVVR